MLEVYILNILIQSHFNNEDVILENVNCEIFLVQSLMDICHPQDEYFEVTTQSEHPESPKFKIRESICGFLDRATPVSLEKI